MSVKPVQLYQCANLPSSKDKIKQFSMQSRV